MYNWPHIWLSVISMMGQKHWWLFYSNWKLTLNIIVLQHVTNWTTEFIIQSGEAQKRRKQLKNWKKGYRYRYRNRYRYRYRAIDIKQNNTTYVTWFGKMYTNGYPFNGLKKWALELLNLFRQTPRRPMINFRLDLAKQLINGFNKRKRKRRCQGALDQPVASQAFQFMSREG